MVEEQLVVGGISDPRVLEAMGTVPRHRFVGEALAPRAYGPHALPIGERQTISQPRTVALVAQALALRGRERVLEIGAGSGYQAAVLACLAESVVAVERIPALAQGAARRLLDLGFANVRVVTGDGARGWRSEAPFDAILLSAAAPVLAAAWTEQLSPGGRLVAPLGGAERQDLVLFERRGDGLTRRGLGPCRYVPLVSA